MSPESPFEDQPIRMPESDAFVFFGASGDLAYKKIFPALHNMVRHGTLTGPVIGVAKSGWGIDQLRERARNSIREHGDGVEDAAFAKLLQKMNYIDGDYSDQATSLRCEENLVMPGGRRIIWLFHRVCLLL
jgi:glucose-6-phosphate 1-dehydrogenase